MIYPLTPVLLNCFNCIFRHLELELLTQFPAPNVEKYLYLWKIDISNIDFNALTKYLSKTIFLKFSAFSVALRHDWDRIYPGLAGQGLINKDFRDLLETNILLSFLSATWEHVEPCIKKLDMSKSLTCALPLRENNTNSLFTAGKSCFSWAKN